MENCEYLILTGDYPECGKDYKKECENCSEYESRKQKLIMPKQLDETITRHAAEWFENHVSFLLGAMSSRNREDAIEGLAGNYKTVEDFSDDSLRVSVAEILHEHDWPHEFDHESDIRLPLARKILSLIRAESN